MTRQLDRKNRTAKHPLLTRKSGTNAPDTYDGHQKIQPRQCRSDTIRDPDSSQRPNADTRGVDKRLPKLQVPHSRGIKQHKKIIGHAMENRPRKAATLEVLYHLAMATTVVALLCR